MSAEVLTIGSEILAGHTCEANFAGIASALAAEGVRLERHTVVPDERAALTAELKRALERSELVIATGGLGATPDDVTRRAVATVLNRKLVFRDDLLAAIREKLRACDSAAGPAVETMALLPAGASPLANRVGLAPGFLLRTERGMLLALPGVPEEMTVMLHEQVLPALREAGLTGRASGETLHTAGVSEAQLAEWVEPLLAEGVRAAYLPVPGRVDLRLSAAGDEPGRRHLQETIGRLQQKLGPHLFGGGATTLEEAVLQQLRQHHLTLAVAESLTGGGLGGALTRVPGASEAFAGGVVAYADAAKQRLLGVPEETLRRYGAVSAPTAIAMAAGARRTFSASVGIATTGIAGPAGGSGEKPVGLVFVALSDGATARAFRYLFGGSRRLIQDRSVSVALNLLRLHLIGRLDLVARHEERRAEPGGPAAEADEDEGGRGGE
jgi:nicotinamide-nucleotide amidase